MAYKAFAPFAERPDLLPIRPDGDTGYLFDGVDTKITTTWRPNMSTGNWTVEFECYALSDNARMSLFDLDGSATECSLRIVPLDVNDWQLRVFGGAVVSDSGYFASHLIQTVRAHIDCDAGTITLYVNGAKKQTTGLTADGNTGDFTIGVGLSDIYPWNGLIRRVRAWENFVLAHTWDLSDIDPVTGIAPDSVGSDNGTVTGGGQRGNVQLAEKAESRRMCRHTGASYFRNSGFSIDTTQDGEISVPFAHTTFPSGTQYLMSLDNVNCYIQMSSGGNLNFRMDTTTNGTLTGVDALMYDGESYEAKMTWDATNMYIYLLDESGNEIDSATIARVGAGGTRSDLVLGARWNGSSAQDFFSGDIYDVRVFNNAVFTNYWKLLNEDYDDQVGSDDMTLTGTGHSQVEPAYIPVRRRAAVIGASNDQLIDWAEECRRLFFDGIERSTIANMHSNRVADTLALADRHGPSVYVLSLVTNSNGSEAGNLSFFQDVVDHIKTTYPYVDDIIVRMDRARSPEKNIRACEDWAEEQEAISGTKISTIFCGDILMDKQEVFMGQGYLHESSLVKNTQYKPGIQFNSSNNTHQNGDGHRQLAAFIDHFERYGVGFYNRVYGLPLENILQFSIIVGESGDERGYKKGEYGSIVGGGTPLVNGVEVVGVFVSGQGAGLALNRTPTLQLDGTGRSATFFDRAYMESWLNACTRSRTYFESWNQWMYTTGTPMGNQPGVTNLADRTQYEFAGNWEVFDYDPDSDFYNRSPMFPAGSQQDIIVLW